MMSGVQDNEQKVKQKAVYTSCKTKTAERVISKQVLY